MPGEAAPFYTISDISERLNFTYRTLHYYEEKLSLKIARNSAGDRIYTEKDIELLEAVKNLKSKGMTLAGIKKFLIEHDLLIVHDTSILSPIEQLDYQKVLLKNEIKAAIKEQFQELTDEVKLLRQESEIFREDVSALIRQTADHYTKFDLFITNWREKKRKGPWFKNLFR